MISGCICGGSMISMSTSLHRFVGCFYFILVNEFLDLVFITTINFCLFLQNGYTICAYVSFKMFLLFPPLSV